MSDAQEGRKSPTDSPEEPNFLSSAWLPGASRGRHIEWRERGADIALDVGRVAIDWQAREPRRIARMVIPRLQVGFAARDVGEAERQQFMRCFDFFTQRGGG